MWPVSRKSYPKQFYPLIRRRSFFQLTVERFKKSFKPEDIFVSTESKYVHFVRRQAPEIPSQNIIAEPERRDNLAAIGLVTAILEKKFPGEVMLAAWSDHLIGKEKTFLKAVKIAGDYARETGLLVSVDQEPTYPSVHNGWLKLGETIDQIKGMRIVRVEKQLEKPDKRNAKIMFRSGGYLLNMGYLAWRTDIMLSYYKEYQPEMYKGLIKIADTWGKAIGKTELYREYHKFKKDSIDYGIFEKLPKDKRVTIPGSFEWEDAGTWQLFYDAFLNGNGKNGHNVIEGGADTEFVESERNLVIGPDNKVITVIGLSDIAVIDTTDGLLVCSLGMTGKVKELFAKLEKENSKYVD